MFLLSLGTSVFLYFFYHLYWKRRNLPPGPTPLPYLGNWLHFWYYGVEEAIELFKDRYGDLHTIWFGHTPVISLHDHPTIHEHFQKNGEVYSGREHGITFLQLTKGGDYGIVFVDGPIWKEQKKFGLRVMKDLGVGKNVMEERILFEVNETIKEIHEEINSGNNNSKVEIDMKDKINRAVGNVINLIILGYRFEKENIQEFYDIKIAVSKMFKVLGNPLFRIMESDSSTYRFLPGFSTVYNEMKDTCVDIFGFLREKIELNRAELEIKGYDGEATDYVEAFLMQEKKLRDEGNTDHFFDDKQLIAATFDLWAGGLETPATTLTWGMIYLAMNPEAQKKLHEELDRVIGSDRPITNADKAALHYVNAVVNEMQRKASIGPINLFHRTLEDVKIHGYDIPKDSIVVDSFPTCMRDTRYFKNPEKFNPDRFIDEEGKFFNAPELTPFGVGRRQCMGEGLARQELFLITANLFNHFRFLQIPEKPIDDKRIVGFTVTSPPFALHAEPRW